MRTRQKTALATSLLWKKKKTAGEGAHVSSRNKIALHREQISATFRPNLFEVLGESYAQAAVPVVEHLARHQRVEHSCACQWHAEVEAKQPPVLCLNVELHVRKEQLI